MSDFQDARLRLKASDDERQSFEALDQQLAFGPLAEHWMEEVCALTYSRISHDAAPADTLRRVRNQNSDAFWGLFEQIGETHRLIGYHAQLMLYACGHATADLTDERADSFQASAKSYRFRRKSASILPVG